MNKSIIYKNKTKDDWYTPKNIIEYARKQMGSIDLDPATTKELATKFGLTWFFNKELNGLTKQWYGNIWLNPPFSNKEMWIKKAREQLELGNAKKIFILLPMSMETKVWHKEILGRAIIHIPNKIIKFDNNLNKNSSPAFGSCIVELTKKENYTYKLFNIKGEKGVRKCLKNL